MRRSNLDGTVTEGEKMLALNVFLGEQAFENGHLRESAGIGAAAVDVATEIAVKAEGLGFLAPIATEVAM